jgi:hypothetical protein
MRISQFLKNLRYPLNSDQNFMLSATVFLSELHARRYYRYHQLWLTSQVRLVPYYATPKSNLTKAGGQTEKTLTVANAGGRGYDIDSETK